MNRTAAEHDIIGGFPYARHCCGGCGKPLLLENAWMTDGCPCNGPLGVNAMNETRWRLLMKLQQRQSRQAEAIKVAVREIIDDASPCTAACNVMVEERLIERAKELLTR